MGKHSVVRHCTVPRRFDLEYDDVEFNAVKWCTEHPLREQVESAFTPTPSSSSLSSSSSLVDEQWTCAHCGTHVYGSGRTVCHSCLAVNAARSEGVVTWRANQNNWSCIGCKELNFSRNTACRCCGRVRGSAALADDAGEADPFIPDPACAVVGSVCNAADALRRWRCERCSCSTQLTQNKCSRCGTHRIKGVRVECPSCGAPATITDVAMKLKCRSCSRSLHGATIADNPKKWGCCCSNICTTLSCSRCRLPRRFPDTTIESQVLSQWDTRGCTNWCCANCYAVNEASRKVVIGIAGTRRITDIVHGQWRCKECGDPWHGQVVNGGSQWRCACHNINSADTKRCSVCLRPAGNVNETTLSFWAAGDWMCPGCGRHNFRGRTRCCCGTYHTAVE